MSTKKRVPKSSRCYISANNFIFLFVFLTLSLSQNSLAIDRKELESRIIETMDVESVVKKSIAVYRKEMLRLYPTLSEEYLDLHYGDVLAQGEKRYLQMYVKSLSIYNRDELQQILDFYDTEFGQWFLKKSRDYNNAVQQDMGNAAKELNDAIIEKGKTIQ